MPTLSSSGMGLIEVVVASGIMGLILLAVSSMIVTQQQGAQAVERRLDAAQLESFIGTIFSNQAVCASSGLIGKPAPAPKLPTTPDTTSVPTLNYASLKFDDGANSMFDNGQLKIAELKYHSVAVLGNIYSVIIRLQVNLQGNSTQTIVGGNVLKPMDFPVAINVNTATHIITGCGGSSQPTVRAFANIYCSPGNFCSLQSSFNIAGFTAVNGTYNITFATPMPDTNYAVLQTANNQHQDMSVNLAGGVSPGSQSTYGFQLHTYARDDGHANNSDLLTVIVFE